MRELNNFGNSWLEYYTQKGKYIDEMKNLSGKINKMFNVVPTNSDTSDALYGSKYGRWSNVINMSPDDYLKQAYNTYHYKHPNVAEPWEHFLNRIKRDTLSGDTSGGHLMYKAMTGQKLDMPELIYDEYGRGLSQEGNHRAMAAKLLGEKEIPVAITTYSGKRGIKEAAKKNILKALRFGGNILRSAPLAEFSLGVDYYPQLDLILEKDPKEYSKKYNKYMGVTPGNPGYMDEQGYLNY